MTPVALVAAVVVAIALGTFLAWYFSADQRLKRRMRATPQRAIADVVEGERVRIVGRVRGDATIAAPLSGRPCVYYRVVVEEQRRRGKSSYWATLVDEERGVEFLVEDGAGVARVPVGHVQAVLEGDARGNSGFLRDPTPELEAFLAARGHATTGWVFNKTIRYREGVAEPGERVAVVGTGRWERDPEASAKAGEGYREATMPKRLVLEAPSDGPLLLSDETDVTAR
ncbi:MAG: hypothetical protein KF729_27300 [Sandaracinaceae bacterium]|nr:hypothetical protein [Sandaracinaceae bacterium]